MNSDTQTWNENDLTTPTLPSRHVDILPRVSPWSGFPQAIFWGLFLGILFNSIFTYLVSIETRLAVMQVRIDALRDRIERLEKTR